MQIDKINIPFELRKHAIVVRGVALILASILVAILISYPLLRAASMAQQDLQTKSAKADALSNEAVFLTGIDKEVLAQRLHILDLTLPPGKDVLLYLATIDGLSRELGLSFKGIQLAPGELATASAKAKSTTNVAGVRTLDTQLTIAGNYQSIFSFLRAIEDTAPLMRVKDVKVSRTSGDSFNLSLMLEMLYADVASAEVVKGKSVLFDDTEEALMTQLSQLRTYAESASPSGVINIGKSDLFTP